ncbi:MAG: RND family transporter [Chitinispirillaceae bacterium]|nr:RND family transporter [Chitinispirillaceae bacterium]
MSKLLTKISRYPLVSITLILAISVVLLIIMKRHSRMETNLDEYMPKNHPAFLYSDQAEEWFDIKDGIIVAIEASGGIYNPQTLSKIKNLTFELQQLSEIEETDVTSLFTADNIVASEGGMDVTPFYENIPSGTEELHKLKAAVESNEMVHGRLVSKDGTVALVIARINDNVFSQKFYKEILTLTEKYNGSEKIYVAGRPIVEGTLALLAPRDMKKMVPVVILVITAVLLLVLRSFWPAFTTLLVVFLSTIWTFGLMALLRIPVYAVSTMIPVMLIAIGVADGIHMFNHLRLHTRATPGISKFEAVAELLHSMWKPVVMTSVTTAVGFFSLITSSVYPIKYFGIFTGLGVLAAMVLSLLFIPAMIILTGIPKTRVQADSSNLSRGKQFAEKFTQALDRSKFLTLIITIVLFAGSLYGISKVWINSSFLDKFEKNSDIVRTDTFINTHFGGTSTLNVVLESETADAFKQPAILSIIDEMQAQAERNIKIGNTFSITDYVKRMNKVMHADSIEFESIPQSSDLVAQYILLYEMSGDPENLTQLVDYDYKKANLTLQLKGDDSKTINEAIDVIHNYAPQLKVHGVAVYFAGSGYKSLVFSDLILQGQILSLFLSLIIVFVLIAVMFRSIKLGLIGSVPIALTALISFGVMGLANIPLSTTTALLSSVAIGIGIDYAIHFLDRFRHYRLLNDNVAEIALLTMNSTGRAILFNAVVVVAGFLVLLFSVFPPNRILGMLVSLNMTLTFLATVTVMYLLLRTLAPVIWKADKS